MMLITGATGFVGSHLVRRVAGEGRPVRALARRPVEIAGAEVFTGDLTEPASLPGVVSGVDVVVHAAAITGNLKEPYGGAYDKINRVGTENLVEAARDAGVRRIVLLSGLGTTRAAAGTYMATRWGMEEAVRGSGLEYAILQPSVLFGDGAEFVGALARLVRTSPVVPIVGGRGLRFQPLWVEDLVTCLLASTGPAAPLGSEVALGGPDQLTMAEILHLIADTLGRRRLFVPVPTAIAALQARVMTAVLPNPPLTPAAIELFAFDNVTDLDSVERSFHFQPRSFRSHLRQRGVDG